MMPINRPTNRVPWMKPTPRKEGKLDYEMLRKALSKLPVGSAVKLKAEGYADVEGIRAVAHKLGTKTGIRYATRRHGTMLYILKLKRIRLENDL
jgi:hypothetical protein